MAVTKESLLKRNSLIESLLKKAEIVEDVCEKKVLERKGEKGQCYYLPQGKLEEPEEYKKRLRMTPQKFETPKIVHDRLGAIFANPPKIVGDNKGDLDFFQKRATVDGKTLPELASICAKWIQTVGFVGIMVDLPKLTPEQQAKKNEGQFSEQDRINAGINPYCVVYDPHSILDFEADASGVQWVKVHEKISKRESFDIEPKVIDSVRIIGKENVQVYEIEGDTVTGPEVISHGFKRCPFAFVTSPLMSGKLARTMLDESAECDVAATRILSDIMWNLHLVGNPILTLKTHSSSDTEKNLGVTPGRYVRLQAGTGGREGEDLTFLVLDSTGIELEFRAWAEMKGQARESAGKAVEAAVTQPTEMSGISRAWEFKTGEERALFLIVLRLQDGFDKIISLVLERAGLPDGSAKVQFNEEFDLRSDAEKIESNKAALEILKPYLLPTVTKIILKQVADAVIKVPESERTSIHAEIDALEMTPKEEDQKNNLENNSGQNKDSE